MIVGPYLKKDWSREDAERMSEIADTARDYMAAYPRATQRQLEFLVGRLERVGPRVAREAIRRVRHAL